MAREIVYGGFTQGFRWGESADTGSGLLGGSRMGNSLLPGSSSGSSYSSSYNGPSYTPTAAPTSNVTAQTAQLEAANPLIQQRMNEQLSQSAVDPYMANLQSMQEGNYGPDDPSYQWRLQQGQQSVERSLAARGLLGSGNAAIELLQYGQGAASQEFAAQWNRLLQASGQYQNMLSGATQRLGTLAGIDLNQRQLSLSANQFNAAQQNAASQFNANYGLEAWAKQQQFGLGAAQQNLQEWETNARIALQQKQLEAAQSQTRAMSNVSVFDSHAQSVWDQQYMQNQANLGAGWARLNDQVNSTYSLSMASGSESPGLSW